MSLFDPSFFELDGIFRLGEHCPSVPRHWCYPLEMHRPIPCGVHTPPHDKLLATLPQTTAGGAPHDGGGGGVGAGAYTRPLFSST